MAAGRKASSGRQAILNHWLAVLPVLLAVAAFGARQIDLYPPDTDEFYSMYSAGWLVAGPWSPLEIIENLHPCCSDHVPGYFLFLSVWGNLISTDLATGRIFSIFCALLLLAVVYRLGRDFVGPAAGFFAVVILASCAFANYYVAHLRMYPLFMLIAAVTLWLYLRLAHQVAKAKPLDYLALGLATLVLLSVHLFSVVFLLPIAAYHLLLAPRGRPWLSLTLTGALAGLLSAPWLLSVVSRTLTMDDKQADMLAQSDATLNILHNALSLLGNGQWLLMALCLAGLAVAAKKFRWHASPFAAIVAFQLLLIVILNEATSYIVTSGYRYLLPSFVPMALLLAGGLYQLIRLRRAFALVLAAWIIGGLAFQANAQWRPFIVGREMAFRFPPWQVIARLAPSDPAPRIALHFNWSIKSFSFNRRIPYSQRLHYFAPKDIPLSEFADLSEFEALANRHQQTEPRMWILYDREEMSPREAKAAGDILRDWHYEQCQSLPVGDAWQALDYAWEILECVGLEPRKAARNNLITHDFFAAEISDDGERLDIVAGWTALAEFAHDDYALSYQLISDDGQNVAQVDLPLSGEGGPRRLTIALADIPPGSYQLMAINYNSRNGERLAWNDTPGYAPAMLPLAEIMISDRLR